MCCRLIIAIMSACALVGCANSEHNGARHHASHCAVIKRELIRRYPSQIQRPTTINRAKLLREYDYYRCDQR